MQADDIYKLQKKLIEGENVNVSETNVLKDFFQIVVKIILILIMLYASLMLVSGIVVSVLPIKRQIEFENFMTRFVSLKTAEFSEPDKIKLEQIKNKILKYDKNFPKTSNLNIKLHPNEESNALCLPNGDIYITSSLYEKIKNNEPMLMFVIAHEMAHYKHKDHIMNIRKDFASTVTVLVVAISTNNDKISSVVSDTIELSDLNYSRAVEARADKYAKRMLLNEYGNTDGGIEVLKLLKDKDYPKFLNIFATHPSIEKRIEELKRTE